MASPEPTREFLPRRRRRSIGAAERIASRPALPRNAIAFVFACMLSAVTFAAPPADLAPGVEAIISRMGQARYDNSARFRPYTVTRDYQLFASEQATAKSQVTADITFVPPGSKNFVIQQANGTGLGEKIVRGMLAGEAAIAKDDSLSEMSPRNYSFRLVREEEMQGHRCYVLELSPRREDGNLLYGNVWVDATTYLPRRLEGRPAKNPSWWVHDPRVCLLYGDVQGMWLQTGLQATATVRILGSYTVVSRDVKYSFGESLANARLPK